MPSFVINNLTAPDTYVFQDANGKWISPSTLDLLPICDHVNLDVFNSGIYWVIKEARVPWGIEMQGDWGVETFMAPGSRTIYNRGAGIIGFKFRAFTLAAQIPVGQLQAQVTIEVVQ